MRHSLVFCEGYQDRGFIGEWLERRLACPRLAGLEVPKLEGRLHEVREGPTGESLRTRQR